jgi:hypothetical protein
MYIVYFSKDKVVFLSGFATEGIVVVDNVLDKAAWEYLQSACRLCDKCKNNFECWGRVNPLSVTRKDETYDCVCPRYHREHFSCSLKSLGKEGHRCIKENGTLNTPMANGKFYRVNNNGCLFGDYDKEQRL